MPWHRYVWMSILASAIIALVVSAALLAQSMLKHAGKDFGMEVSPTVMWVIFLSDLLLTFWFIWVPLVVGLCLVAARRGPSK